MQFDLSTLSFVICAFGVLAMKPLKTFYTAIIIVKKQDGADVEGKNEVFSFSYYEIELETPGHKLNKS